jgi:hypothetical protein
VPNTLTGELSLEDRQFVADWVVKHHPNELECPICGKDEWTVGGHLVRPISGPPNLANLGGYTYPLVMLISVPCGYTMFLNAVMMGLAKQAAVPTASPPNDARSE